MNTNGAYSYADLGYPPEYDLEVEYDEEERKFLTMEEQILTLLRDNGFGKFADEIEYSRPDEYIKAIESQIAHKTRC
ncbi:hypothetical protein ACQP4Q_02305 [Actinobacillus pleuropneumoniae]|uniref:Uncharacterized protein n=1 Tax=Actinobacillus pleuropneumoniae TaxID=715 RepID=A0A9Q4H5P3_ACTPL|nr:hypothetical protein [Actinobacillus pleuropneumoniae]MCL7721935.1 hypothetical protein [Actinobacillus pleuropneumoniae]MCL7726837.1 hypothetical protein [Actinobacillus pleuropneumoniae]MCL7730335.1 hypothetical protein [Actinobacillus pleuropneumoniae]MCY6367418.1 hypothetical protein [Actinobacillus pleuropneumoniae]MCY6384285.1 hypothetical protein [Actinobacillus pleuropneumoniae]